MHGQNRVFSILRGIDETNQIQNFIYRDKYDEEGAQH